MKVSAWSNSKRLPLHLILLFSFSLFFLFFFPPNFRSLNFYPFSSLFKPPIILRLPRDSRVYVKTPPQSLASAAARPFHPLLPQQLVTSLFGCIFRPPIHLQVLPVILLGHYLPRAGLSLLSVSANSRNQLKSDSELRVISLIHNTLRSPITLVYHERVLQPS